MDTEAKVVYDPDAVHGESVERKLPEFLRIAFPYRKEDGTMAEEFIDCITTECETLSFAKTDDGKGAGILAVASGRLPVGLFLELDARTIDNLLQGLQILKDKFYND